MIPTPRRLNRTVLKNISVSLHQRCFYLSDKFFQKNRAQVDLDALKHNFEVLRSIVPDSAEILGIVKADAYAHGGR